MNLFIIGAGFTKAVFPRAPLNRDLIETLASRSSGSQAPLLLDHYMTHDIEIALTRLDAEHALLERGSGQSGEDLRNLRQGIEQELADYFRTLHVTEDIFERSQG